MILPVHPNIARRSDPYTTGKLACFLALWVVILASWSLIAEWVLS